MAAAVRRSAARAPTLRRAVLSALVWAASSVPVLVLVPPPAYPRAPAASGL
jgi:hypothetical protein